MIQKKRQEEQTNASNDSMIKQQIRLFRQMRQNVSDMIQQPIVEWETNRSNCLLSGNKYIHIHTKNNEVLKEGEG